MTEIEQLRQRVAELEVFAELNSAKHYKELADSQLQIKKLREALEELSLYIAHNGDDWVRNKARTALGDATTDDSALQEYVRERLVKVGVFANVNALTPQDGERWEHMVDDSYNGEDYIYLYALKDKP